MTEHDVGPDDLRDGELRGLRIDGRAIVVARVDGRLYAVDGVCTHQNFLLEDGELVGRAVRCHRHGAAFDLATGAVVAPPDCGPLRTFLVRSAGGRLLVSAD